MCIIKGKINILVFNLYKKIIEDKNKYALWYYFFMKSLIIKNAQMSSKGNGIRWKVDDKNYWVSLEVLAGFGITGNSVLSERMIILDDKKEIRKNKNWYFLNSINIMKITADKDEIGKHEEEIKEKVREINKKYEEEIFDENLDDDYIDTNPIKEIDFDSLYSGVDFYEITEQKKKISPNEKLIQKSIKLKPTKYNNGIVKVDDYNYLTIKSMTNEDFDSFIEGKITSIKIKKISTPKIPEKYKDKPEEIIKFLHSKNLDSYITKTDEASFLKGTLSIKELIDKMLKTSNAKFVKLQKVAKKALMIKRETGMNPFVLAWPYVVGKTERGTLIHAPLAYRNISIKESLNEYEFTIDDNFTINTYPILKNYTDNNNEVNEITPLHSNLKDVLIEFYKHGIKVTKPSSSKIINYVKIDKDADGYLNNLFTLSNEAILKLKPSDEHIFYDLKNIIKNYGDFSLPSSTFEFAPEVPSSIPRSFINDVDNSKANAIKKALDKSVVIFGPPGTGKSATITSIIGKIISSNKNALFVAEKATAINVIESNLREIGLSDFVVNLNDTSKIEFEKKFNNIIKIVHNPKYKEIIDIPAIDYASKWLNSNSSRYNILKQFIDRFESLKTLGEVISLVNIMNDNNFSLSSTKEMIDLNSKISNYKRDLTNAKKKATMLNNQIEKLNIQIKLFVKKQVDDFNNLAHFEKIFETWEELSKVSETNTTLEATPLLFQPKNDRRAKKIEKTSREIIRRAILFSKEAVNEYENQMNTKERLISEYDFIKNDINIRESSLKRYNEDYVSLVLGHEDIVKMLTEDDIKKIKDNNEVLNIDLNVEWDNLNRQKKHDIKKVRKAIINNYAVNFKNWLKNNPDMVKKVKRLTTFVNNQLHNRNQNIIKMFQVGYDVLTKLFPTIMMNPDLVSMIIPPKKGMFDYSIFDEASQIRLHKAIPALHRSNITIVAGDDKQLGPTDLFTDIERDEDYDLDLEEDISLNNNTLLNYAKDEYYNVHLTTHYRSKSKDLIEFSNKTFYDNRIMMADTPNPSFDGDPPIIVEEIGGIWEHEYINHDEARRAVELVQKYRELGKTVGVITFNNPQKKLIGELLVSNINGDLLQPDEFFIKSIKDVQGDEMDVIVFSLAYGKRRSSDTYTSSFGQFSKEKINVAITRSKLRVHVLKSIPSIKIDARNDDTLVFKRWLEFIENYSQSKFDFSNHKNTFRSEFEEDYFNTINKLYGSDFLIMSNYNVGPKEIDIVIYDKHKNEFLGAIELDGVRYHGDLEEILNDYERQNFLENLGWKFIRTTPSQYYSNRDRRVEEDFNNLLKTNQ